MILIAGGSGFFGINTALCLAVRGEEVILLHRHTIDKPPLLAPYWGKQVKQVMGDLLDLPTLMGIVKEYSVDSIIHAAHHTYGSSHGADTDEPLHQLVRVQIEGTTNVLELGRLMGLRRITFISSVDLYRGWPRQCDQWHEDSYLPPVSFSEIGNNKRAVEQLGFLYSKRYGLSFASLRVGSNYGPVCFGAKTAMVKNALEGKTKNFSHIPANLRSHTVYVKDTGEGTCAVHLADSLDHYIYNLSDGGNPTMQEIADQAMKMIPGAEIQLGPPGEEKTEYRPVSMERMKREFGFVPHNIQQGIAAYINWYKTGKY